jgi:hypothetical protein
MQPVDLSPSSDATALAKMRCKAHLTCLSLHLTPSEVNRPYTEASTGGSPLYRQENAGVPFDGRQMFLGPDTCVGVSVMARLREKTGCRLLLRLSSPSPFSANEGTVADTR